MMDKENVYIHTMEYYSALKKEGNSIIQTTWMDLEDIILMNKYKKDNTG